MARMRNSLLSRAATQSMHWAVRVWPQSSREWGMAVLGELDEIVEPRAALSWAVGGMLLFLRAMLAQLLDWMKLPVGKGFSAPALPSEGNGPQFPKHSRLATAVVLLAASILFFLPVGHEARTIVGASWRTEDSEQDRQELDRMAALAGKNRDGRALGFVALSEPDSNKATKFAERAVDLDPSLIWLYASSFPRPDGPQPKVYLASAHVVGGPRVRDVMKSYGGGLDRVRAALASESEWLKDMDQAFRAPRYDDYYSRRVASIQEGWRKVPNLSPGLAGLGTFLGSYPDLTEIDAYVDLQIENARRAGAAGHLPEAQQMLSQVVDFGKRMNEGGTTQIDRIMGLQIARQGLKGMRQVYAESSLVEGVAKTDTLLQANQKAQEAVKHTYPSLRVAALERLRTDALFVHGSVIAAMVWTIITVLALFALEAAAVLAWRKNNLWRRFACFTADYGPTLALAASVLFLWSFRPFARAIEQLPPSQGEIRDPFQYAWQLRILQTMSPTFYFSRADHQYTAWWVLTLTLAGVGVLVALRGLLRAKAAVRP